VHKTKHPIQYFFYFLLLLLKHLVFNFISRKLEISRTGWRSWTLTVKVSMQRYAIFISHDSYLQSQL
jgi:hypothetical protein